MGGGTFRKWKGGFGNRLVVGLLFWESSHPRALGYTKQRIAKEVLTKQMKGYLVTMMKMGAEKWVLSVVGDDGTMCIVF